MSLVGRGNGGEKLAENAVVEMARVLYNWCY